MDVIEASIDRYKDKMSRCKTMTDLLVVMSSWQSFAESHRLTAEQMSVVSQVYLEAEQRLMANVKTSLW